MADNKFEGYWQKRMESVTARLEAARQLFDHNLTRGLLAEIVLRDLLREFLPMRCGIGTGFMLSVDGKSSKQIDILIFDQLEYVPLYRDGDLVVVSPDAAYLAIEVKTSLGKAELRDSFGIASSVKGLNPNARCIAFGYQSPKESGTIQSHLAELKTAYAGVPDQILYLESRVVTVWDPAATQYTGYEMGENFTGQLINEVISAGKAFNLQPYLGGLKAGSTLFTV